MNQGGSGDVVDSGTSGVVDYGAAQLLSMRNDAMNVLKVFVEKYGNDICSHSFLKGLRVLFNRQKQESQFVCAWNLPETLFTATASEQYMCDLLHLLFHLGFDTIRAMTSSTIQDEQDNRDANEIIEAHSTAIIVFTVNSKWSNRDLNYLLSLIPHDKHLQTRPYDNITVMEDVPRYVVDSGSSSFYQFIVHIWTFLGQFFSRSN